MAILKKFITNKFYAMGLLMALAAGLRLFLLQFEYAAGWDEINYLKLGASGALYGWGHVLHPYWSPLYPFSIALMAKVIPDFELAGRMVSLLFGVVLIAPFYVLVARFYSTKVAWYGSLIIAFFPMLIESSVSALTESLYIFLAITGILVGLQAMKQPSAKLAAITGILFGLSYLTRPEGIGLFIAFIAVDLIVWINQIFRQHRSRLHWIGISAVGCFMVISAPYWVYLHHATGHWTLSSKGTANLHGALTAMEHKDQSVNPWLLLNDDNTRLPDDDIYHTGDFLKNYHSSKVPARSGMENNLEGTADLLRFVKKYLKDFHQVNTGAIGNVLGLPLLVLAVLGLLGGIDTQQRLWQDLYLLSYVLFFWVVVIPIFHVTERYLLPMVPIVLIWSARGIDHLIEWLRSVTTAISRSRSRIWIILVPGLLVVLWIGSYIFPGMARMALKNPYSIEKWAEPIEMKKAGLWLKDHSQKQPIVMSWNHAISFYAGNYDIRQTVSIPHHELDRVLAYARHRGAKYIALNEKNQHDFPTVRFLLDETQAPAELKLIYKDESIPGLKTVIYEIGE